MARVALRRLDQLRGDDEALRAAAADLDALRELAAEVGADGGDAAEVLAGEAAALEVRAREAAWRTLLDRPDELRGARRRSRGSTRWARRP